MSTQIFIPNEAILPSQFFNPSRTRSGVHRLLTATLENALICLDTYKNTRRPSQRHIYIEARNWFLSHSDLPMTWRYVAHHLGIDPEKVASWVTQTYPEMSPIYRVPGRPSLPHTITLRNVTILKWEWPKVWICLEDGRCFVISMSSIRPGSQISRTVGSTGEICISRRIAKALGILNPQTYQEAA